MASKINYIGLFLTSDSREKLKSLVPAYHAKRHMCHVTLVYAPTNEQILSFKEHALESVPVCVNSMVWDWKAQAFIVSLPGCISILRSLDANFPHITYSTASDVPPKYSNDLMINEHWNAFPVGPVIVETVLDSFPRGLLLGYAE